jgi:hypothetical protein
VCISVFSLRQVVRSLLGLRSFRGVANDYAGQTARPQSTTVSSECKFSICFTEKGNFNTFAQNTLLIGLCSCGCGAHHRVIAGGRFQDGGSVGLIIKGQSVQLFLLSAIRPSKLRPTPRLRNVAQQSFSDAAPLPRTRPAILYNVTLRRLRATIVAMEK